MGREAFPLSSSGDVGGGSSRTTEDGEACVCSPAAGSRRRRLQFQCVLSRFCQLRIRTASGGDQKGPARQHKAVGLRNCSLLLLLALLIVAFCEGSLRFKNRRLLCPQGWLRTVPRTLSEARARQSKGQPWLCLSSRELKGKPQLVRAVGKKWARGQPWLCLSSRELKGKPQLVRAVGKKWAQGHEWT